MKKFLIYDGKIDKAKISYKTYNKVKKRIHKETLTSTVFIEGANYTRLPVKTNIPVSHDLFFKFIKEMHKIKVKSPIKMGDIIMYNILNTGIHIIACRDM